jgi:hypothetical protein
MDDAFVCQECGGVVEHANTPHDYRDCWVVKALRERDEARRQLAEEREQRDEAAVLVNTLCRTEDDLAEANERARVFGNWNGALLSDLAEAAWVVRLLIDWAQRTYRWSLSAAERRANATRTDWTALPRWLRKEIER